MRRELFALPEVALGAMDLHRCVESYKLYDAHDLQIVHWKCHHDGDAMRAERHHTKYVLSITRSGACCVHDGAWYATVDPTTAVLNRPGNAYRTTHPFGCNDDGWSIAFGEEMAEMLLREAGVDPATWDRPSITVATQPARRALQNLIMIERASFHEPIDALTVESLCVDLFRDLLGAGGRGQVGDCDTATADVHRKIAEQACQYINENYREVLKLDTIGRAVGASPAHLCRIFKSHTGLAMSRYVKRLRLMTAIIDIAAGAGSLSQVALDVGFYSHSHFTSAFTAELGIPPTRIRSAIAADNLPEVIQRLQITPSTTRAH